MAELVNWDHYGVRQIWEMIKEESTRIGEQQAGAWRNTAAICEEQAAQMEKAATQLAETWIPSPGSAAEAFQVWIRRFTMSMRQSAEVARTNAEVITDITYQLTFARDRINSLVIQGIDNKYAEEHQWLPKLAGHSALEPSGIPLPPEGWRDSLDEQARTIMTHTETTIIAQTERVRPTPSFKVVPPIDEGQPPPDSTGGSSAWSFSGAGSGRSIEPPIFPLSAAGVRESTGHDPIPVGLGSDAPVLDGSGSTSPTTTPVGAFGPTSWFPSSARVTTPAGEAWAPGAVIGAPRPGGTASGGRPQTDPRHPPAGAPRSGSAGMPMAPMVPPPAAGRVGASSLAAGGRANSSGRRRGRPDLDDPWAVPQGGPAILEPRAEPEKHDPGPGVIGIDR
jgi:hypothetical protein